MEESESKFDTINIVTEINELIVQTEVTQYFKNSIITQYKIEEKYKDILIKFLIYLNNRIFEYLFFIIIIQIIDIKFL